MNQDILTSEKNVCDATYDNCYQHFADELQKLHLRIQAQVLKSRKSFSIHPYEALKGLVLSDEEINEILNEQSTTSGNENVNSPEDSELHNCLIQMKRLEEQIAKTVDRSSSRGLYLPLIHLVELLRLTPFERDCLIICIAPELDLRYEKLYAYIQDDVTKKSPTVNLVLDMLCNSFEERLAARQAFSPEAPLLQYNLLEVLDEVPERTSPLLARFLRLDDRMVNFLLGWNPIDSRLLQFVCWGDTGTGWRGIGLDEEMQKRLRILMEQHWIRTNEANREDCPGNGVVFSFEGPHGIGKRMSAEALCGEFGIPLLIVDVGRLLHNELNFRTAVGLIIREAILHGAALYWDNFGLLLSDEHRIQPFHHFVTEGLRRFSGITFLANCGTWEPIEVLDDRRFMRIGFPMPFYPMRKQIWEVWSDGTASPELSIDELAGKFRLGPGQIRDAVSIAQNLACWRDPEGGQIAAEDLSAACRARSRQGLSSLAQKIAPRYTWDDIVLPEDAMKQLQEMCNTVRYRGLVQDGWGFARKLSLGRGVTALFAGPSGTGKTMAAEVVANELALDLYKIDLSSVVSKYIGETERNLERIFQAAEDSNAILFFDEADALFGKRSAVRDSHDRYANIEISYLLQKMEAYDGVAILASNMRQHLDEAFLRRLTFSVLFPFPDEADRRRIWETIWPAETPRDADLDLDSVAKQFKLSGGNIKNIALAAAFLAASDGAVVTMDNLLQATRREFQKMGKTLSEDELGIHRS